MTAFYEFGQQLAEHTGRDALAETILAELCDFTEAQGGALYGLGGGQEERLVRLATSDFGSVHVPESIPLGEIPAHADRGSPLAPAAAVTGPGLQIPLVQGDRVVGLLWLASSQQRRLQADEAFLHLADQAAVALANATSRAARTAWPS